MMLELTTRSRRRAARNRRTVVQLASLLLLLIALSFVVPVAAGVHFHTVTDNAMSGTMGKGSAVIVESVPVADLELGDIITYPTLSPDGPLITRRIAGIEGGVYRTMGDGAGSLDPWIVTLDGSRQDVVVSHVPYAGYAVDVLGGPVRVWLAGILVGLIVAALVSGAMATRRDERTAAGTEARPDAGDGTPARRTRVPAARRSREARRDTTV
jgi:signal peptidase